jgi:hypothetical protein
MKIIRILSVAAFAVVSLFGADMSGTWTGEVKVPTGQALPFVVHLKQDGTKITGKMDGIGGAPDVLIENGKIEGETITYEGVRKINNADVRFQYTAKPVGDTLEFKIERVDGQGAPLASVTKRTGN